MDNAIGTLIKEARKTAGMSQARLAEITGISARDISKAERGEKELTEEQLKAIAEAANAGPDYFPGIKGQADAAAISDEDLLALFRSADPSAQETALFILKGGQPKSVDIVTIIGSLLDSMGKNGGGVGGLLSSLFRENNGDTARELINFAKVTFAGDNGKRILKSISGMLGSGNKNEQNGKAISSSLLAFTFYYAVAIYILLLSFYFWLWRKDIKPQK